jgi:hypothetical protein|tara:strand:- start:2070 stop:2174 length:105 start_codon:yes stop_codon:yes gene_type:complete
MNKYKYSEINEIKNPYDHVGKKSNEIPNIIYTIL